MEAAHRGVAVLRSCDRFHSEFDRLANGEVQIGQLPAWMHVNGRVAWYVFQGPYSGISKGWSEFWAKFRKAGLSIEGAPGDVYVCPPDEHKDEDQRTLISILWAPLKE